MSSSFMADISSLGSEAVSVKKSTSRKDNTELKMEDFLKLMVVQLQSQTIDDTADTGEMLNQLVQMQMVTALSNMTDASVMSYASSLVGKEVTIVGVDKENNLEEKVLTVIGTGVYNGQQVVFCDDGEMYQLNQIMAVGRLPEIDKEEGDTEPTEPADPEKEANDRIDKLVSDIKNGAYDTNKTDGADNTGKTDDVGAVKDPEGTQESGSDSDAANDNGVRDPLASGLPEDMRTTPTYNGEQGAPRDGE